MGTRSNRNAVAATARTVAAQVVERVLHDQAFAAAALDAELDRAAQLQTRDKRLATELTYGTLRVRVLLEKRIGRHAPRGLKSVDHATLAHLLVASYQLLVLEKIPAFAAVSEAVDGVRAGRGEGMARFANAVLRKLAHEVETTGRVPLQQAVVESVHPWLLSRIGQALGSVEQARDYVTAGPWPPAVCLRLRMREDRSSWLGRLAQEVDGAQVEAGRASPLCVCLQGAGQVARLSGHGTHWIVQEEGSQVVGLALGARPTDRVLDACAGRGNKTTLLAEQAHHGTVDAADLYDAKLRTLRGQVEAMGGQLGASYGVDWSAGTGDVPEGYDRVLVDAPCSGIGTIRRRPDLLTRDLKGALPGLQQLQATVLAHAASRCRPGGRVVYSVCSVLQEEAEAVVERARAQCPWLRPAPFDAPELVSLAGEATSLRLVPHVHGTDGYFVASLERTR
ncbi:MAG: Sun protein [Deltaproteobacteria bacterium]|nr:Sun protein [Deltaproteobacteria bacterium]